MLSQLAVELQISAVAPSTLFRGRGSGSFAMCRDSSITASFSMMQLSAK
jgi:hypothetical protein